MVPKLAKPKLKVGVGGKRPAPPQAAAPAAAIACTSEFSLELRTGEVDRANTGYLLELENWLDTINGHPLFHNMSSQEPRQITNSAEDTGFQSVFDNDLYQKAIASGNYTAGGNLFWVDLRWSATPGVPLRLQAVKKLSKTLFHEPSPYPGALHVAVAPGYEPLNHRGGWHGVSPEELTHGMIHAVAEAVRTEADNAVLLNDWKR